MKKLFLITFTITFFLSCEKNEGIGGTSMISGKIMALEGSFNSI